VAAEDDADEVGLGGDEVAQAQAEIEARPLPAEPAEPAAESVRNSFRPVGGGREGDQRVGVEMVDVRSRRNPCKGVSIEAPLARPERAWSSSATMSSRSRPS
jgi:hypothetical protein